MRGSLSNLFAVLAVIFAVLAIGLYIRDGRQGIAPVPTAAAGSNQIVNVTDALKAGGLPVTQPPGLFVPKGALDVPGQGVEIDGNPAFVFLYASPQAAAADAAAVSADAAVPERLGGKPAPPGPRRMVQESNVIVLMIGGADDTWQKVEAAVATLS